MCALRPITPSPASADVPNDNDIFALACKLVDTASEDRKTFWLPVLSQLCEAVRKQDAWVKGGASSPASEGTAREALREEGWPFSNVRAAGGAFESLTALLNRVALAEHNQTIDDTIIFIANVTKNSHERVSIARTGAQICLRLLELKKGPDDTTNTKPNTEQPTNETNDRRATGSSGETNSETGRVKI